MKICQGFLCKQENHIITFRAYDIEKIEKIKPEMLSRIFVPECSDRDCYPKNCDKITGSVLNCVNCERPHFQELLIDGWYVGNENGFLDDNSYVASLQTGIRVPIDKTIYDTWVNGFTNESMSFEDPIYIVKG